MRKQKKAEDRTEAGLPRVESGIPVPPPSGRMSTVFGGMSTAQFIGRMQVGESFWTDKLPSGRTKAKLYKVKQHGMDVVTRSETKDGVPGVRVWRTK